MFDSILGALGMAGDALSAPGDYLRGALSGRIGDRASGRDMLSSWGLDPGDGLGGRAAGFGAELATDPLTYLGGAAGRLLGGKASKAAEAAGPGYATSADDVRRMVGEFAKGAEFTPRLQSEVRLKDLLSHPQAGRILSEIPEGSSVLGVGAEGMAFGTPQGDVLRLGRAMGGEGRPVSDAVLQPTRAVGFEGKTPYTAERLPKAENVGDASFWKGRDPQTMLRPLDRLDQDLAASGLKLGDRHFGNVGVVKGRPVVIDPGAVDLAEGADVARSAVTPAAEPGPLMRQLLSVLGGQGRTREALAGGLAGPDFRTELTLAGGGLGSVGGALGRASRSDR